MTSSTTTTTTTTKMANHSNGVVMNSHHDSHHYPQQQQQQHHQCVYNGVNPHYPGLRMIHQNPHIYCVDQFLSPWECDFLIHAASDSFVPAPVVGQGNGVISSSRTSSSCYLDRDDLPDLMYKVSALTGKPIQHCELPQVGRYLATQQYYAHFDAFDLDKEDGRRFASNGGQRTVTVLIYLNTVTNGGATEFPTLHLKVQPQRGMALIFFPATIHGVLDTQTLHAAMPAIDTKFVSQIWIRQSCYYGQPSKRLSVPLRRRLPSTSSSQNSLNHHHHHHHHHDYDCALDPIITEEQEQQILLQQQHLLQQTIPPHSFSKSDTTTIMSVPSTDMSSSDMVEDDHMSQ